MGYSSISRLFSRCSPVAIAKALKCLDELQSTPLPPDAYETCEVSPPWRSSHGSSWLWALCVVSWEEARASTRRTRNALPVPVRSPTPDWYSNMVAAQLISCHECLVNMLSELSEKLKASEMIQVWTCCLMLRKNSSMAMIYRSIWSRFDIWHRWRPVQTLPNVLPHGSPPFRYNKSRTSCGKSF